MWIKSSMCQSVFIILDLPKWGSKEELQNIFIIIVKLWKAFCAKKEKKIFVDYSLH